MKSAVLTRRFLQVALLSVVNLIGLYSYATSSRKVTIPLTVTNTSLSAPSPSALLLNNGSSVSVTYSLNCYSNNGTPTYSKSGLVLNPKAQIAHGRGAMCSNGSYPALGSDLKNDMLACGYGQFGSGGVTAAGQCPSGYSLCTHAQVQANGSALGMHQTGWTSDVVTAFVSITARPFYTSTNNGSTWNGGYSSSDTPISSANPNSKCANDSSGAGAQGNCSSVSDNYGAGAEASSFCCKNVGTLVETPSHSCVVEIESSTSPEGYLQSPQFKGGAPF